MRFHQEKGVDIIRMKVSCPKDPLSLFKFKGENPVTGTGEIKLELKSPVDEKKIALVMKCEL